MAPTVREICAHLELRGPAGIHRVLGVLKDQGYIISEPGKKRSWRTRAENTGQGIPLLGTIAAGVPLEAIENVEEELAVSPGLFGYDLCFGLRVSGDSMIDAHILDGDLAIIRPQQRVENGEIAAVTVDGKLPEATLPKTELGAIIILGQQGQNILPAVRFRLGSFSCCPAFPVNGIGVIAFSRGLPSHRFLRFQWRCAAPVSRLPGG
jgi:SOS regulatory protein LexA